VLNNLSLVIQSEDVDPCPVAVAGPLLETVKDDEVPFRQDAAKLHVLAWILARHPFEVLDEGLFAVSHDWVVLGVGRSDVTPDGFSRL